MGILQRAGSEGRSAKHARATSVVTLAGLIVNMLWALANVFAGDIHVAVENALVAMGFLAGYVLNRQGRRDLAPALVTLVFLLHMAFVTVTFGYATGAHHFFLLGTVVPYLMFRRSARVAASGFAVLSGTAYIACVLLKDRLPGNLVIVDESVMAVANAVFLLAILSATTAFFVSQMRKSDDELEAAYERSESLLYNLLPSKVVARLKNDPQATIADNLPRAAILFADLVGFTERSSRHPPADVVNFLNRIFTAFDQLAEKHGVEKIKTIGDAYMAGAGMPEPCPNPVHRVADMALEMQRTVRELSAEFPEGLQVRIGLHAGPAVAGVIGNKRLFYDVWGETVNTASRMESHGEPGRIQVTQSAYEELSADYLFEPRGTVEVKGMGSIRTWWLTGKAAPASGPGRRSQS